MATAQAEPAAAAKQEEVEPAAGATQKQAAPTADAKQKQVETALNRAFINDTESRTRALATDRRHLADRFESVLGNFVDIGGYFRAGYARDTQGGPMAAFQAPGATTKYRLGNEAENYGELIFGKSVYLPGVFHMDDELRPDGSLKGPIARVQVRLSFLNKYAEAGSSSFTSVGLPEAWASIGNVLPFAPSAKFWAGNRFYRRHDIHVLDFFYWNMSGGGGGIEDVQVGPAKLALAWIGLGSNSGLSYLPTPDPTNLAGFSKQNWELRMYDLPLWGGNLEVGITYAHSQSGFDGLGRQAPPSQGMAVNATHTITNFLSADGVQKLSLQYGTGAAKTFTSGFETITQSGAVYIRPEENGAFRYRLTESFSAKVAKRLSLGPVLVLQGTNFGDGTGTTHWVSVGARPILHFSEYINLALEGGVDWVRDGSTNTDGALFKMTIAPQVAIGDTFASRPVIRAFCTLASWSDSFVGQVGGQDFVNQSSGVNMGAQMEAWW